MPNPFSIDPGKDFGEFVSSPVLCPKSLPIIGHASSLLRDPLRFFRTLPQYGDLVPIDLGPTHMYVACTPELTEQILHDDCTFDKGGVFIDRIRETFGNGLATCSHDQHRRLRRLTQPAFNSRRFPVYMQVMTDQIRAVTSSWHEGRVIDVLAEMQAVTAKTTLATLFAEQSSGDTDFGAMLDDLNAIVRSTYLRMFMPMWMKSMPVFGNGRFYRARTHFRETIGAIIADYRARGIDHGDLLSALLTGAADDRLSDREVADQCATFFAGGTDTTAAAIAWALHLLAAHPHVEEKLHAEVDTVLAGNFATYDDLPRLRTTGHVIAEALRIYPPVWFFTRVTTRRVHLGGFTIPAGETVAYSPYLIHHRPDLYADPERFDPDRWTDRRGATHPAGATMVPFGAGPRKCIGAALGIAEATLTVASLASRWRFHHVPGTQSHPAARAALFPRNLHMRLSCR